MTRDEQRQAWRAYMTALLSASDFRDYAMDALADVADVMLKTEQQRFDAPDHVADAGKMVEPSELVGLTDDDMKEIERVWFDRQVRTTRCAIELTQLWLREKNGGER